MTQTGDGYGKKRILVVDDAAIILSRIWDALRNDYEVTMVNSGIRALKYLEQENTDLILLDIRMPLKDGIQTLREIRAMEDRADIPVIMLTGLEDKRSVMEGIKLGICDYILKPFTPEDLRERIQRALETSAESPAQPEGTEEQ